jgi:hypothetical protein
MSLIQMDMEIKKLHAKIEAQEVLYPLFSSLLRKTQIKDEEGSLRAPKTKISRDDTGKVLPVFKEIAQKSNLKLTDVLLDTDSAIKGSGYLLVNVIMNGKFFNFRDFLFHLGKIPYVEHLERVQINKSVREPEELEFRLKIWLTQE